MSIALKESREKLYRLRILEATEVVSTNKLNDLKTEAEELTKVLASIIVSTKKNV